MHPTRLSRTSAGGSPRQSGPTRNWSVTHRRACSSRRCRSSRDYWANQYDWRKVEARLNALPQFITNIDGVDIHFIHVRSKHPNALPLIITHGWPGSIIEAVEDHRSADESDGPWRKRIGRFRRRDSVAAGLWILGEADRARLGSGPHRTRLDRADEAPRIHAIRRSRRRLGRSGHGADGRAGTFGSARHPPEHAGRCAGRNREGTPVRRARRRRASRPTRGRRTTSSTSSTSMAWPTRRR